MFTRYNQTMKIDFPFYYTVLPNTTIDNMLSQLYFHIANQTLETCTKLFYNYAFKENGFPLTTCTSRQPNRPLVAKGCERESKLHIPL